jgi:plastocyanin
VLTVTAAPRPVPKAARVHHTRHTLVARHTRRAATTGLAGRVTAHVAGDPGVTVADFHFSPATTTIHAGDTITWTNDGPSSHTATAHGGSFDTGVLKKGQSASHTFTAPGTFSYFCQIHPFMHGTVVVLAATTSSATSTQTSAATTPATTTPPATTAAASDGPTLPNTGFNVLAGLGVGLLLLALGAGVRRGARWQMRWGRPPA